MMKIQPLFGAGTNWDNSNEWADYYEVELNSHINVFKLFVSSFNPGPEYTLTINPGLLNYQAIATLD